MGLIALVKGYLARVKRRASGQFLVSKPKLFNSVLLTGVCCLTVLWLDDGLLATVCSKILAEHLVHSAASAGPNENGNDSAARSNAGHKLPRRHVIADSNLGETGTRQDDTVTFGTNFRNDPGRNGSYRVLWSRAYPRFRMASVNFAPGDATSERVFRTGLCTTDLLATYDTPDKLQGRVVAAPAARWPVGYIDCGYRSDIATVLPDPVPSDDTTSKADVGHPDHIPSNGSMWKPRTIEPATSKRLVKRHLLATVAKASQRISAPPGPEKALEAFRQRQAQRRKELPTREYVRPEHVAPLIVPDGWSFQHFLDGSLPKLIQALPVLRRDPEVVLALDKPPRDRIILDILDRLGFNRSSLAYLWGPRRDASRASRGGSRGPLWWGQRWARLYYLCWTPPLHPELWQRAQHLMGVYEGGPAVRQELVILMIRNNMNSMNRGRLMMNQEEVKTFLSAKYGDKFLAFDSGEMSKKYAGKNLLNPTVEIFRRARVIIGVHGGAMYNQMFARRDTHVVELFPAAPAPNATRYQMGGNKCMMFFNANLLDQVYWPVAVPTNDPQGNLVVPLKQLSQMLTNIDAGDPASFRRNPASQRWHEPEHSTSSAHGT